ncbi:hypothetical protein [Ferruginibacter sp.]
MKFQHIYLTTTLIKTMIHQPAILVCVFILSACTSVSQKKNTIPEDELLEKELAAQKNAKYGQNIPPIEIITEAKKVADLRALIQQKIVEKKKIEAVREVKNFTISKRYKNGDKTVVPAILKILQSNDAEARHTIYAELAKDFEDPDSYEISEPALVTQLLNGITNATDEEAAVQCAGITKLKGAEEQFEKRLLSGKSTDEGRILFWLAQNGKSKIAFDYIDTKIRRRTMAPGELEKVIIGLEEYKSSSDNVIRKRVGDLALFIYQNKLIADEEYEELKESGFSSGAAESVLSCLFECGDERVIPIAKDIIQRKIRIERPVLALIRLEGEKHLDKVYKYLSSEEDFYTGLGIVESLDAKFISDKLLREVLIQKAKDKANDDMGIERIIKLYKKNGAEKYLKDPHLVIKDENLVNRVAALYKFSLISPETVVQELLDWGLIVNRPSENMLKEIARESDNHPDAVAISILEKQQVLLSFDTETDMIPVDYNVLLGKFAAIANGEFKDVLVYMDVKEEDTESKYTITVVTNKRAYISKFVDSADWYNMALVKSLLEKILEDCNTQKKFVSINSGDQTSMYIYGNPVNINLFLKKYNMQSD